MFDQSQDHFDAHNLATFRQRYYINTEYWQPGGPLFHVLGGESPIGPEQAKQSYPFATQVLAKKFSGMVLVTEHRYFGESLPFGPERSFTEGYNGGLGLLNVEQALRDFIAVASNVTASRCRGSACPVIALGGSYPGLLATMIRMRYPDQVFASLAASAPLGFLAGKADAHGWFRVVTEAAAALDPECPRATRRMFAALLSATDDELMREARFCDEGFDSEFLHQEAVALARSRIATYAMGNYPPIKSPLAAACRRMVAAPTGLAAARALLIGGERVGAQCASIRDELPSGQGATIECVDKTGCGGGRAGQAWEFMGCTWIRIDIATNNVTDMFPPADWSESATAEHCMRRFGTVPRPSVLPSRFDFEDPQHLARVTSRIVFTNGLRDGWSVGGILQSPSADLPAITMTNGAHHSEMLLPNENDTKDVIAARAEIEMHLRRWLSEPGPKQDLRADLFLYGNLLARGEGEVGATVSIPMLASGCIFSAFMAFVLGRVWGEHAVGRVPQGLEGRLLG